MKTDTKVEVIEIVRGDSPLILGLPHTGTYVPPIIFERLNETGQQLSDTDWHVHQLYEGLCENVSSVRALFHRYVIDANRDPSGKSLYPGQNTTSLCPTIDFDNTDIYRDEQAPLPDEIEARRVDFHAVYHKALSEEIARVKAKHGFAILFDCHSIRSQIPHLFDGKLPDFNIGTFDGQSCDNQVARIVQSICGNAEDYSHVLNGRFKGGWTTRHYGDPQNGVHAIQMEMAQSTYMDENHPWSYKPELADKVRPHLKDILSALAASNLSLN